MKSLESIYESILLENQNTNNIDLELLKSCVKGTYTINDDGSIDVDGDVNLSRKKLTKIPFKFRNVSGSFFCYNNQNLPYSELFKIVDNVKCNIYYSSFNTSDDKDKIRRDRDIKETLKDDELGNLDVWNP